MADFNWDELPVITSAKRLGVQWPSWMGDWFTSYSPRNGNSNAEGSWADWAELAARILAHPFTAQVAPHLHRTDLPLDEGGFGSHRAGSLTEDDIRAKLEADE